MRPAHYWRLVRHQGAINAAAAAVLGALGAWGLLSYMQPCPEASMCMLTSLRPGQNDETSPEEGPLSTYEAWRYGAAGGYTAGYKLAIKHGTALGFCAGVIAALATQWAMRAWGAHS